MATITEERQERFERILDDINVFTDQLHGQPIIENLRELWEEIKSTDEVQQIS